MSEAIRNAADRLSDAQATFQAVEAAYLAGNATADELRTAWLARDKAERELARAHAERLRQTQEQPKDKWL